MSVWKKYRRGESGSGLRMRRIVSSSRKILQELQHRLQNLLGTQVIRIDEQMSMFAGVGETSKLLLMVFFKPVQSAPRRADRERCSKINEEIGLGDHLPHGLYVGMFLCNVTALVA